jgi:hypothetical protein
MASPECTMVSILAFKRPGYFVFVHAPALWPQQSMQYLTMALLSDWLVAVLH